MSQETYRRTESIQPLHELATNMAHEMGEQPEQRLEWLMNQDGESLGRLLVGVNSIARGIAPEAHDFDGHNVQAGTIGGSIPPDQDDKITLLGELMNGTKEHIAKQIVKGEDAQTIMTELAVAIPTVVNKLHLFADGNGRTSRMLRMVLRDGDQINDDKIDALVNKKGIEKYDTTPVTPIEDSITAHMRAINGASGIGVLDDVGGEITFIEEINENILAQFPVISPGVLKAYRDSDNFSETVRLLGKDQGAADQVSLKELFGKLTSDPNELQKFTDTYRSVRKQRVELLIGGLLGNEPIVLSVRNKDRDGANWFNSQRVRNGLTAIDTSYINTIQDFQMAYTETFSPQRTMA